MNYLMIGIIILSIIVLVLGFFLLYYQAINLFQPQTPPSMFTIRANKDYEEAYNNYDYGRQFIKRVNLLQEQRHVMSEYVDIMEARAKFEGIDLD
ncbi:TPA: hypothetical protein TUU97_000843 [Streptococcus equi subsp. zooepidemicus]|nr:hypothetical protein [Streptococcus equi subsp. zooepidemicus]